MNDAHVVIAWIRTERPRDFLVEEAAWSLRHHVADAAERNSRANAVCELLADLGLLRLARRGGARHTDRYWAYSAEMRAS